MVARRSPRRERGASRRRLHKRPVEGDPVLYNFQLRMPIFARSLTVGARMTALACSLAVLPGCALMKRKAVGMVASTLASSGDVFTRDDDLELIGNSISV